MRQDLEETKQLVPLGIYAHYKHPAEGRYEVIGVGILESTEGVCVVYKRVKTGWLWVRTLEDFTAEVEVDGKKRKRFILLK